MLWSRLSRARSNVGCLSKPLRCTATTVSLHLKGACPDLAEGWAICVPIFWGVECSLAGMRVFHEENLASEPLLFFLICWFFFLVLETVLYIATPSYCSVFSRTAASPPHHSLEGKEMFVDCHGTLWRQIVVNIFRPDFVSGSGVDMFLCAECSSWSVRARDFLTFFLFLPSSGRALPLRNNAREKKKYGRVHRKFCLVR